MDLDVRSPHDGSFLFVPRTRHLHGRCSKDSPPLILLFVAPNEPTNREVTKAIALRV